MVMDWEVAGHIIALGGVFINFMRIGEWKARQETRLAALERQQEAYDNKIEELTRLVSSQNNILTEVKVKLDLMCAEKSKRRRNDKSGD